MMCSCSRRARVYVLLALAFSALLVSLQPARSDWNLVWSDEFNGATLDTNKWTFYYGNLGDNEKEIFTGLHNLYVTNGALHIVARQEITNGYQYTSSLIMTTGLFSKAYGRFEFRGKLPKGDAFHSAFWMLPAGNTYGYWPNAGEIDVMEQPGYQPTEVTGSIHYGKNNSFSMSAYNFPAGESITDFHTYRIDWFTNSISWFIDGVRYQTQSNWFVNIGNSSGTYPYPAPFNVPFFLIISLSIGGDYVNNPSASVINALLSAEMLVDYVRVYDETPPLRIQAARSNGQVVLRWPTNIACRLQSQTKSPSGTPSTNWTDIVNGANPYMVPVGTSNAWYRLQSP